VAEYGYPKVHGGKNIYNDAFMLWHCYLTRKRKEANYRVVLPGIVLVVVFFSSLINILPQLKEHAYEMTHQYKGPLDYTIGFAGNNVRDEITMTPDIIAYRKYWPRFRNVFNDYFKRAAYEPAMFPVADALVNNIAELNLMPALNHKFRTVHTENPQEATYLYIKK
jgi:hypothetical protein